MQEVVSQSHFLKQLEKYRFENPTLFGVCVSPEGHLVFDACGRLPALHFSYAGTAFTVTFEKEDAHWHGKIYGALGAIPFSGEDVQRRTLFLNLLMASEGLKGQAKMEVTPDRHLVIVQSMELPEHFSTATIFASLVIPLWEMTPLLKFARAL